MFWCDFIAGWVGGSVGIAVGHPFDTLKVRQQAFTNPGLLHAAKNCYKFEGIHGFFKGMSYPLVSAGVLNSLFFGTYGVALRALRGDAKRQQRPSNAEVYLAGCAGGVAQLFVACPIDLVKIKLQTQTVHEKFHGPFDVLRQLFQHHGVRGCYKGFVVMAYRDIPASAIYVVLYENLSSSFKTKSHWCMFISGGVAGVVSWMSIIPLDVVKSRIQADDPYKPQYRGILDCFRQCYRQGGIRIFSRGVSAVALRAFPLNGATFLGYEYMLDACKKLHLE